MKSSRTITSSQLVSWALSGGGGVLSQASPGPPCSPGLSEEEGGGGAEHGDDDAKEDEGDRGGRAGAIPTDAPPSPLSGLSATRDLFTGLAKPGAFAGPSLTFVTASDEKKLRASLQLGFGPELHLEGSFLTKTLATQNKPAGWIRTFGDMSCFR